MAEDQEQVRAADGHVYSRKAIEEWFETHDTSPMTNRPMANKLLTPVGVAEAESAKPSTTAGGSERGRIVEEPFKWIPPSVLRSLGQRVARLEMTLSGNVKGHGKQSTRRQPKQTKKNFKQQKRHQNIKNATINKAAAAAGTIVTNNLFAAVPCCADLHIFLASCKFLAPLLTTTLRACCVSYYLVAGLSKEGWQACLFQTYGLVHEWVRACERASVRRTLFLSVFLPFSLSVCLSQQFNCPICNNDCSTALPARLVCCCRLLCVVRCATLMEIVQPHHLVHRSCFCSQVFHGMSKSECAKQQMAFLGWCSIAFSLGG